MKQQQQMKNQLEMKKIKMYQFHYFLEYLIINLIGDFDKAQHKSCSFIFIFLCTEDNYYNEILSFVISLFFENKKRLIKIKNFSFKIGLIKDKSFI
jgi:hypothetical protein